MKRPSAGKHITDIEHEVHNSYEDFIKLYGKSKIFYVTRYGMQYHSEPNYKIIKEDIFLMFGRESTGISKEILASHLDHCIRIPMTYKSRSLNLANSVMLVAYEVLRQQGYPNLSKFEVQKGKE
jgi:tRNA (cytidine/uridine-2'-O-)-methyltransferase